MKWCYGTKYQLFININDCSIEARLGYLISDLSRNQALLSQIIAPIAAVSFVF